VAAEPAPTSGSVETVTRPEQVARTGRISEPAPLRPRVTLAELAEEARAVIRMTAGGGLSAARIILSPPELGQVEIRLRYRGGGVRAELSAESVQAAQALGQASAELRRSLEDQGLTVLGLDIRHSGPEAREDAHGGDGRPGSGRSPSDEAGEETAASQAIASPRDPAGVQIDVLA
jgi:flagellar hook-length control protein FliK